MSNSINIATGGIIASLIFLACGLIALLAEPGVIERTWNHLALNTEEVES